MSFAALPLWAVLSAMGVTLAAVVAIYLLRRTPRPLVVSNVDFWMRAAQSARPRVFASLKIPWLALLVSALVALTMVVLIGDPRFGEGVRGTTVIVVDAGRSMGALDATGRRRIDRAMDEVRRWVERSTIAGEVAIVRAGMRPSILLPVTEHAADLEAAMRAGEGPTVDDGPSDLRAAIALADAIVLARSTAAARGANGAAVQGQILLATDQDVALEPRAPLVTLPVGAAAETVAITSFSARRVPEAVGEYVVRLEVTNFSSRSARLRAVVRDHEVEILSEQLEIAPWAREVLGASGFSSRRAELTATLADLDLGGGRDGLSSDDQAAAVVEGLDATRVLLVTEGDRYLEAALATHPGLDVEVLEPSGITAASTASLARYDVVVLDGARLPPGVAHRALVVFGPVGSELASAARPLSSPPITGVLASHPVLEGLSFEGVTVSRARPLAERLGDQVLLRSRGAALALARESRDARLVVFGFDTTDTNLVERETFPLLIHAALRWVATDDASSPLPRPVGGPLQVDGSARVRGPEGEPIEVRGGEVPVVTRAGLYRVGDDVVAFSATRHAGPLTVRASGGRFATETRWPSLAVLLAALLLLLMMLEWTLLHRGRLG